MDEYFENIGFKRIETIPNRFHFIKDVVPGMRIHILIQLNGEEMKVRKCLTSASYVLGINEMSTNFNLDEMIAVNRWCRRFIENVQLCNAHGQGL